MIETSGNSNIGTVVATITPVDDEPNTMDATAMTDEDIDYVIHWVNRYFREK